jgi:FKBP12-rapamycin complex-associated protein
VGSGGGEARRYAAVLVLRELAEHAPEVFNVHISSFIDAVWPALRDSRLFARQAAVRALRACLVVIERRETRYRVQWYYRLYEETQNGLKRDESGGAHAGGAVGSSAEVRLKSPSKTMNASASSRRALAPGSTVTPPGSVESQHGSLLAFGELLRHTGEFMLSRYKEVAETVLGLHESREKIVRRAVLELVPKLAAFSPKRFTESYLERSMRLLLSCLKNQAERDAGFTAIGDVAAALAAADETDAGAAERAANGEQTRAASAGAYGSPGGSPRRVTRAASFQSEFQSDDRSSAGGLRFKGAARTGPATEPDEYGVGEGSGSGRDRGAFA